MSRRVLIWEKIHHKKQKNKKTKGTKNGRTNTMRRIAIALVFFAAIITTASARLKNSPAADSFDRIREFIKQQLTERRLPSISVAVARDGKIIWEEAFGWADRENRIAATPHTMYSLASISKPITATGLMILKERGRIELDRPINEYLGEAKIAVRVGNPAEATVRRVANHTAGLPLHYQFFYEDEPYRAPSRDETIRRYGNCVTAPGERFQYSNLGYGILDYVIARVSRRSYADFMREEVFLPLGLTHTSVDIGQGLEKHQAVRYGTDGLPIPFYNFDHPGGSAVYASAHDLVRFGVFHLKAHLPDQKAILKDETIDEMQKTTIETGNKSGYGVGWSTGESSGGRRSVAHGGGMGGVSTLLQLYPAEKIAVVVLSNASSNLPGQVMERIVAALLPDAARNQGGQNQAPSEQVFKPSSELLGAWQGKVHTHKEEIPFTLVFQSDGDVHARLGTQLNTLVNRVGFGDGYVRGSFTGDIGTEDANRTRYVLSLSLKLRGDVLNGAMTAQSLPGRRVGNALTHWVELKKGE
jgi:CubicO group peptidase (beta-lactamase class C family)